MSEPAAPPSRRRRVLAVLLGLVVALLVAEGVLRLTGAGTWHPRFAQYHFLRNTGELFWRFDPQQPPVQSWDGDPYRCLPPGAAMTYEINRAGLRGPLPPEGKPTVLVLGDSFTFGEGVEVEDTFVGRLGKAFPDGPVFVNAGVSGYGTREEAARLPFLLDRFTPKAVIVVFVPNDAIPLEDSFDRDDLILDKRPLEEQPVGLLGLASGILGRAARDEAVREWELSYYTGARRKEWDATRKALVAMQSAAKARHAAFGVALFPLLANIDERPLAPVHDLVAAACAEIGAPFLDLSPAFHGMRDWELWVHPTDHHPNRTAHAKAAEALRPFVASLLAGAK